MKKFVWAFALLWVVSTSFGQIISDPTSWSFSAKKIKGADYELNIQCKLKPEWHLWSLDPGGDGLLMPPTFTFEKNKQVQLIGYKLGKYHKFR